MLFGYLAAVHVARARDRRHHPPPAPDRARRQAGRRGRPADRRAVPPRRRHRVERRRVRGARACRSPTAAGACPSRSRCCAGCWTEPVVTHDGEFDRITGGRPRPAPAAATDPDLDRRPVRAGLPPRRPARRRLVPAGRRRARRSTRPAPSSRRPPSRRGATRRRWAWRAGSAGPTTGVDKLVDHVGRWRDAGATHLSVNTMNAGLGAVDGTSRCSPTSPPRSACRADPHAALATRRRECQAGDRHAGARCASPVGRRRPAGDRRPARRRARRGARGGPTRSCRRRRCARRPPARARSSTASVVTSVAVARMRGSSSSGPGSAWMTRHGRAASPIPSAIGGIAAKSRPPARIGQNGCRRGAPSRRTVAR